MEKVLISPEFRVTCGMYELTDGIGVKCVSSSAARSDWAEISLTEELWGLVSCGDGEESTVELGYQDDYEIILSGYVKKTEDATPTILVQDDMIRLDRSLVQGTFLECYPEDVLRYVLHKAGITEYRMVEEVREKKSVFTLPACSARKAIEEINAFWGLAYSFYFRNHVFYWGTDPDQEMVYVLEEEETIIDMVQRGALWEIETIAVPWIHHSEQVEVVHSKYTGTAIVNQTIVRSDERGRTRMYIYVREI